MRHYLAGCIGCGSLKNGTTTKFWAKFVERFGNPLLVGKSSKSLEGMLKALLNAHASSVMFINADESVEAINSLKMVQQHLSHLIKKIERSIQKLVLGQTLTSGTDSSGSRSLEKFILKCKTIKLTLTFAWLHQRFRQWLMHCVVLNGWERHLIVIGDEKSLNAPKADRDVKLKMLGQTYRSNTFFRVWIARGWYCRNPTWAAPNTQFNALPHRAFSFKASVQKSSHLNSRKRSITDGQGDLQLLTNDQIKQLATESDTPEALLFNLTRLIPDATAVAIQCSARSGFI